VDEQVFRGGLTEVVRRGDRLYRPARPWSPTALDLLGHIRRAGFEGAPEPFGLESGFEVLAWIEGTVEDTSGQEHDLETVRAAAQLLRRYHDATAGFDAGGREWQFPAEEPPEVILHGDPAPYNCVFRDKRPVAWIDFDCAHPGPRLKDVAYGAYRFCLIREPLESVDENDVGRVLAFVDAYRLGDEERARLPEAMAARLRWLAALIRTGASAGDRAFAAHLAAGDADLYEQHAETIERSQAMRRALERP
jgi:hypothetical protein